MPENEVSEIEHVETAINRFWTTGWECVILRVYHESSTFRNGRNRSYTKMLTTTEYRRTSRNLLDK
jgi:hypothetical protein